MDDEISIGLIMLTIFMCFAAFGIGWCTGNDVTVKSTRQTLCREFMKETPDYINCNTKNLDNVIKIIKEQTNENRI